MKLVTRKLSLPGALLCAVLIPLGSHAECKRAALDLPVTISGTRPLITAKINGQEVRLLVDSGAFFSMMSSAAAEELKLKMGPAPFGLRVVGIGGSTVPSVGTAKVFTLAKIDIPNVEFLVGGSEAGSGSIGILGQNFLEKWDVEYDLAHGMIRLMKDTDCRKQLLAYWVQPDQAYTLIHIDKATPREPHTKGIAYINGNRIRVMFDTGANRSVLSLRAAALAGVKTDSPGVIEGGLSRGLGSGMVRSYIAPFASFKFADGEEIKNAKLRIADIGVDTDMLIGADFFLSHRVFVANSQDKLYFTYNGGPVFDLRTAPATPVPTTGDSTADSPAKPAHADASAGGEGQADAAALARRGSASAGRLDLDAALADFTRACELEPNNPEYFYERGRVYWQKKDSEKALADFNRALELKPDFVPALLSRAEFQLNAKNIPQARADLDALDKLAAKQSDVRYEMAVAYERANLLPAAITQFDLWIAAHQEDSRLVHALSGRCRAKGMLGQDLAAALKDCNTAVNRSVKGTNAVVLGNRALVRLRLGDYDKAIADFDAALKLQPNVAWTLYGRGVAKLKKNKTKEGEADMAEAAKIAPLVAESYKKLGIAP